MIEERTVKKKSRFLLGVVVGLILGFAVSHFLPVWLDRYLPDSWWGGHLVVGEVLDKGKRSDQLLLKVSTEDGVLLATFTEKLEEIDLLVEKGDSITLRVRDYQPFLNDPPLERVRKPGAMAEAEPSPAREPSELWQSMERSFDELEVKIDELEKAADDAESGAEPEVRELMEELRTKREAMRDKLSQWKQSSGDAWEELKEGTERAWEELKEAFERASLRLRDESPER